MDFINLNSNRGLVNLLADFILNEINENEKYDTVIEVTDCGRFFVVNGLTSRKEIVDLSNVNSKFKKQYEDLLSKLGYKDINIIDLIIYDNQLSKKEEFWFTFYNTKRPIYSEKIIDSSSSELRYQKISDSFIELDYSENKTEGLGFFTYSPLNISSEFPYGYSYNMGRNFLYYSEYICNQLFKPLMCNEIKFKCSLNKNSNDDYDIDIVSNSIYDANKIKSMILDVFDFNLNKFKNKIVNYNYTEDLTQPINEKPWLIKDETKNLIIF